MAPTPVDGGGSLEAASVDAFAVGDECQPVFGALVGLANGVAVGLFKANELTPGG